MALIDGDDLINGTNVPFQQMNRMKNHFRGATEPPAIQPGMLFSDSDDEALYHRQAALSKHILQETDCMLYADSKLATLASANMNPGGATPVMTTLYTVPAGKSCIITKVVIRNSSGNLTTASISFGFDAVGSDCITNATHVTLTGSTIYEIIPAKVGAVRGVAAGTFKIAVNTKQGGAMTISIDVFGYLF
jgi:hypothetical protein